MLSTLFKPVKLLGSCVFGIGNNSSCDSYYSLFDCSCLVELIELAGRFASVCPLLVQVELVEQVVQVGLVVQAEQAEQAEQIADL